MTQRAVRTARVVVVAPGFDLSPGVLPWLEEQDLNPNWPAHIRATLADLGTRLGHGV
jgi:hypothetical protein